MGALFGVGRAAIPLLFWLDPQRVFGLGPRPSFLVVCPSMFLAWSVDLARPLPN